MTAIAEKILRQALDLPPVKRAELIEGLLHSFDERQDECLDTRWAQEAESRIDAYESGKITADSAEVVFDRINRR